MGSLTGEGEVWDGERRLARVCFDLRARSDGGSEGDMLVTGDYWRDVLGRQDARLQLRTLEDERMPLYIKDGGPLVYAVQALGSNSTLRRAA